MNMYMYARMYDVRMYIPVPVPVLYGTVSHGTVVPYWYRYRGTDGRGRYGTDYGTSVGYGTILPSILLESYSSTLLVGALRRYSYSTVI